MGLVSDTEHADNPAIFPMFIFMVAAVDDPISRETRTKWKKEENVKTTTMYGLCKPFLGHCQLTTLD